MNGESHLPQVPKGTDTQTAEAHEEIVFFHLQPPTRLALSTKDLGHTHSLYPQGKVTGLAGVQ